MSMDKNYREYIIGKLTAPGADDILYDTEDKLTARECLYITLRRSGLNKYAEQMIEDHVFAPERLLWLNRYLGRVSDSEYYRKRAQLADKRRERELAQAEREERMMEVRAQQSGTKEYHQAHNQLKLNNQRKR